MFELIFLSSLFSKVYSYPIPDGESSIQINSDSFGPVLVMLITFSTMFGVFLISGIIVYCVARKIKISDEELSREEDEQAYLELNSDEQELYFQSKEYLQANPYNNSNLTNSQTLLIQEKGVKAWEFMKDQALTVNDLIIMNKYELNFFKKLECSSQTNLPIPKTNEVYYFESKIFSLPYPDSTRISIGLAIKPYPFFRLPGRHHYSVSYDSDGYRRVNQPFKITSEPPFPAMSQGDVIGIGYRTRSGTIFFTRNGRKISESKIGGHIKGMKLNLYPTVGANNLCSIHVNVGQMGFVFIEGNVKKWGFGPLQGTGPSPPAYNKFNGDILLARSEIDEENDLLDRENDFPPNFWDCANSESNNDKFSYNVYDEYDENDENITLASLPQEPPSYDPDSTSDPDSINDDMVTHRREGSSSNNQFLEQSTLNNKHVDCDNESTNSNDDSNEGNGTDVILNV